MSHLTHGSIDSMGVRLFTTVQHTSATPHARLLVLHGYGDHSERYHEVMTAAAAAGIESHAFDFRGHGRSEGRRGFVKRWDDYLDDLDAVAATMPTDRPRFVLAHSHGGLVAVIAAQRDRLRVDGVVLASPYLVSAVAVPWFKRLLAAGANVVAPSVRIGNGLRADMMTDDPAMLAASQHDPLLLRCATPRWFSGAMRAQSEAMTNAARFRLPLLMLIGDADTIASPTGNRAFFNLCRSTDKQLVAHPQRRHELLRESNRAKVFEAVVGWIAKRS
jgi:alpha-beta hydrolase superfamily lysophospholipase